MAIKGVPLTVAYVAWNNTTSTGQTGDAANHTLRVIKDGSAAVPTNSPAEVDAVACPGVYKLALTAAEMTCDTMVVAGKSSTAGVSLIPIQIVTEHGVLPTVPQGNAGAVLTAGTGTAQLNVAGGNLAGTGDGGFTLLQMVQYIGAAVCGQLTGSETATEIYAGMNAPATPRLTVVTDAQGNRTSITFS
jgi:hypothetical protein